MTVSGWLTIFLFVGILTALAIPLGNYMAAVYTGERTFMDRILGGPERLLYRVMRVDTGRGMDWKAYARSLILFSLAGWLLLYFFLRTQTLWNWTGLNPLGLPLRSGKRHLQHHLVVPHQHQLAVLRR